MEPSTFLSFIIFEIVFVSVLAFFIFTWEKELLRLIFNIKLYFNMLGIAILWLAHFGNQSYRIVYKKPEDEAGEYRTIEFPAIWM